jgi:hypothetical protein
MPTLQHPDQWCEHEAEKDRQRDRDKQFTPEVERTDDDRRNDRDTCHGLDRS